MEQSKKRLKETQEELSEEASAKVCHRALSLSLSLHVFKSVVQVHYEHLVKFSLVLS